MPIDKTLTKHHARVWTNASVRKLLKTVGDDDPVRAITRRAREVALDAMDKGWSGPPFDPLRLADHLGIAVSPRHDVGDARTLPGPGGRVLVEFNPNRPSARVRYSIAHEIAHTLFPDCRDRIRHRSPHDELQGDEWQLEAICNVGAAELLMPLGSLKSAKDSAFTMEAMLALRKQFEVSMEALLIRIVRLTDAPVAMFCAARAETGRHEGRFSLSYKIGSQGWPHLDIDSEAPPLNTVLSECTAIGYTAAATESWGRTRVHVEAVGIPPYPGARFPRVVGVLKPLDKVAAQAGATSLRFVRGDALKPRGSGSRMVVHIVNDKTPNWGGGGFAQALKKRWPAAQADFRQLIAQHRQALALGNARICGLPDGVLVASVVAQKGYGESVGPRIRYAALRKGLETVAETAVQKGATVHMPRIGTGQGGGAWSVIEDIIQTVFGEKGISVTVYDLPGAPPPPRMPLQDELSFA
jgi:O-acetyl-ADP-ribose deacetylase (regulator of RNase III)